MEYKGRRYTYELKSDSPAEVGVVARAYQTAGWIEVDFIHQEGYPTHIIFEWTLDRPLIYPVIDWP